MFVAIIILFIISYSITKDLFSPGCIICLSYLVSIISGYINSSILGWDYSIEGKTAGICIVGISVFVIVFFFLHFVLLRIYRYKSQEKRIIKVKPLSISKTKIIVMIGFQSVTLFLTLFYFSRNIGAIGWSNITSIMNSYRMSYYFGDNPSSVIPFYVNQLTKFSRVIAYSCLYLFVANNFSYQKDGKKWIYLVPCVIYIPIVLLSGGRYYIIMLFFSALFIWAIFHGAISGTELKSSEYLRIIAIVLCIVLFFSATRGLVGRTSQSGIIEYISGYFGKQIKNFDLFLSMPRKGSSIWGKETFYSLNRFLNKLGIAPYYSIYLEFNNFQGIAMGNTYTSFRCMIQDFGMLGVLILQSIEALILTTMYVQIKTANDLSYNIELLFYSMMMSTLVLHSYSEGFYNEVVSTSYIIYYFGFVFFRLFLSIKTGGDGKIRIARIF